jgi:hypothetical protein
MTQVALPRSGNSNYPANVAAGNLVGNPTGTDGVVQSIPPSMARGILSLGNVALVTVPTIDPGVSGQVWLDVATLKVSTGSISFSHSMDFSDDRNSHYVAFFNEDF